MQIKYLFILMLLFIGNNPDEEVMSWSETKKLTWKDFKAEPNQKSDAVALTASGITFGFSIKTSDKRVVGFSTTVESHFYPNKSWYFKEKCSDLILRHEQLHFDITELYARKFREKISKLQANRNIKKQLNGLHASINNELNKTQKRYDEETDHSINEAAQNHWENFIAKELMKLEQFKSK